MNQMHLSYVTVGWRSVGFYWKVRGVGSPRILNLGRGELYCTNLCPVRSSLRQLEVPPNVKKEAAARIASPAKSSSNVLLGDRVDDAASLFG